jgi:hypothetical protein
MAKGNLDELKSVLNRALTLEYTLIIHYPRLAAMIPDEATRKLASEYLSDTAGQVEDGAQVAPAERLSRRR